MTPSTTSASRMSLLTWGAAILMGIGGACLRAQQPMLNAAGLNEPLHRIVLQRDPEPTAPEPPQGNGSTPVLKDDLFAGTEKFAKGATEATEVNMDPESLDMVRGNDAHKAHKMILSVVRSYSYDKPGMYNPADVDEFRRKLESPDWHCSVHVRDLKTGESTDICSRRRAPDMIEHAIITVAPKELTFIHNIRKVNGEGGGLDLGNLPGMAEIENIPGLSPLMSMEAMNPAWKAEMLVATAVLRAQVQAMHEQFGK